MPNPGIALLVVVGIGVGAFLYYMFAENANNPNAQHQNSYSQDQHSYRESPTEYFDKGPYNGPRARRRKRSESGQSDQSTSCTICLEEIVDKMPVQLFECSHIFHETCIRDWCRIGENGSRNLCPNCRSNRNARKC